MRKTVLGSIIGLGLIIVVLGWGYPLAQADPRNSAQDRGVGGDSLQALSFDAGDGRQQVTVLDPKLKTLAVYHVDRATGAITLKSVRSMTWDLLMEDYNSAKPTPGDIRSLSEQR